MNSKVAEYAKLPPFMSIEDAVKATGLSAYSLRQGCKDGSIPHIMSGNKYYINYYKLLERDDSPVRNCSA